MIKAPKEVHIFNKNISFPVLVYACNEWEQTQVSYLSQNVAKGGFTTMAISQWCKNHQINYQIIYPKNKLKLLLKEPMRFMCYLYIRKQGY